jgi:hypothetical protein
MSSEEDYIRIKAYLEEYSKQIRDGLLKSHEHFDKTLTLISSGGLVLSMTFVEKVGGANPIFLSFLIISWCFLASTLLLSLTSSILSIRNHNKVDKSLDKVTDKLNSSDWTILEERNKFYSAYDVHVKIVEKTNRGADFLTWAPYVTLLLGSIFLIAFSSINLLSQDTNGKRTIKTVNQPKQSPNARYTRDSLTQAPTDTTIKTTRP